MKWSKRSSRVSRKPRWELSQVHLETVCKQMLDQTVWYPRNEITVTTLYSIYINYKISICVRACYKMKDTVTQVLQFYLKISSPTGTIVWVIFDRSVWGGGSRARLCKLSAMLTFNYAAFVVILCSKNKHLHSVIFYS